MSTSVATSKCDQTFDFDDADIILRSSDGVEFYVHRCILRRISPVFADMFSLPQPQPGHSDDAGIIIDMAEDAASLRLLLGVCYPRTFCIEPKLDDIIDIKRVAVMTRKFDSDTLTWAVESALSRYAQQKPGVAYAIAWRYELKNALRTAARASIHHVPFLTHDWDVSEFEEIPATSLIQLSRYHNTVTSVFERFSTSPIDWITYAELPYTDCTDDVLILSFIEGPHIIFRNVRVWWWNYVANVVAILRKSDRPQLDVAFRHAFQDMVSKGLQVCSDCRSGRWYSIIETTRTKLHDEIERRLSEIPLDTPF